MVANSTVVGEDELYLQQRAGLPSHDPNLFGHQRWLEQTLFFTNSIVVLLESLKEWETSEEQMATLFVKALKI